MVLFLASRTKRYAWRHLVKVLVFAGLVLALGKPIFDLIYNRAQGTLFNTSRTAAWQKSMTLFAHSAIDYTTHINMVGGIAYLALALVIIIGLLITRSGWGIRRSSPAATEVAPLDGTVRPAEPPVPETRVKRPPTIGGRGSIQ